MEFAVKPQNNTNDKYKICHPQKEASTEKRLTSLLTTRQRAERIDWKNTVTTKIIDEWKKCQAVNEDPTLREMFYLLGVKGIIPNTNTAYKGLSKAIIRAKKAKTLPYMAFPDEIRYTTNEPGEYLKPEEYVNIRTSQLKNAAKTYRVPRWYGQPRYVEVWVEKAAQAKNLASILRDKEILIAVNRGYSSWSFIFENCQRLYNLLKEGKQIHVLYFGDFDPSGEDMDRQLKDALEHFKLIKHVDFQRIAVTEDQINKYTLPHKPDKKTQEKLEGTTEKKGDTRTPNFIKKHGSLKVVELDALKALKPTEFKELVLEVVDRYFDQGIYDQVQQAHPTQEVSRLVYKKVRFLNNSVIDDLKL